MLEKHGNTLDMFDTHFLEYINNNDFTSLAYVGCKAKSKNVFYQMTNNVHIYTYTLTLHFDILASNIYMFVMYLYIYIVFVL